MEPKTIVVVGGGYAGIHVIHHMKKIFKHELGKTIRLLLIDKNTYHLRKVLLFKPVVEKADIHIPLKSYCGSQVELLQGEVLTIDSTINSLQLASTQGFQQIHYDYLVLAVGSVVREVDLGKGGVALDGIPSAESIRKQVMDRLADLQRASEKKLRIAVVGGGITGIETAAEMAVWLNRETKNSPIEVQMSLFNTSQRLLPHTPDKVGRRLEQELTQLGVKVIHGTRVDRFHEGILHFTDQSRQQADVCIWTTGLEANPILRQFGLPLATDGRLLVESDYRVTGTSRIYALGDAAHLSDPTTGQVATMTCKEAIPQAERVCKNIRASLEGGRPVLHEQYPPLYCIGLGPDKGLVWSQKWGIDFIVTGRLGEKIRRYTWDQASLVQN
ncbi:NAD(P)/FAD-dependent oxidoreductase [Brevibacillus ginsengisoli]|uniref:NAD(P)/FAD-dependent oxidoreductase n=1 Tax=Brevibacillus ginsengisoli TaxID=363854 RepID=UPI003CE7CE4B